MSDAAIAPEALISHTTEIVAAMVGRNDVAVADLPGLIREVHGALAGLAPNDVEPEQSHEPAVPVRASIRPDHLVCLEDGRKLKMLKRYLKLRYDMTPEQYRRKWRLPADYPMVAPAYAEQRSALAKRIGLGTRAR